MRKRILRGLMTAMLTLALSNGVIFAGPLEDGQAAYDRGDYGTALQLIMPLSTQGNAVAQYDLGLMYANGRGVSQDDKQAVKWFRLAAAKGVVAAQDSLGLMYANGRGVPKDYNEAIKWLRLAAAKGVVAAQDSLGWMYANGQGVPKDYNEAIKWYRLSAAQGNAIAQNALGEMYAIGRGVSKDYNEAVRLYRLAAAQGNADAQNNLGSMYVIGGGGVPKDYEEAVKWYRLAAAQGNADAQTDLGLMYQYGWGVPKDYNEAVKWYRLAAAQGNATAQTDLGSMYQNGWGVPKDYVLTYMWLAVGKNYLIAVTSEMTPAQIELAQKMAKRCEESNYKQCGEPSDQNSSSATTSVPMQSEGGAYVVSVIINDAITLNFIVDSGAADVSIPADVVMTLMRTGTLKESDFLGEKTYVLADGSKIPSQTFHIRSLKVGNKVLENVNGSVASVNGSLLLGQSFLGRFKSWSVDNTKHALVFE
jgi:TPR repeat protein